jgi:4Fe-4S ferredoxin
MLKTENENELVVEMILHAKRYSLTLNKKKCVGCGICMQICPREAIEVTPTPKAEGEEAKIPTVAINKEKCTYCGICEAICPFGALTTKINGEHTVPVIESESFPQLKREITVDETKCGLECTEIEEACPLDLIKVSMNAKKGKVTIEVDKEACPGCRMCETKFPEGTIHVKKVLEGIVRIDSEKCPEGCHDCLDVCPIPKRQTASTVAHAKLFAQRKAPLSSTEHAFITLQFTQAHGIRLLKNLPPQGL